MSASPSSSGLLLPLPGSPASSWVLYRARLKALVSGPGPSIFVAFWLFGLINNVLYVIILSAAQDLVGTLPKGVVLLADVVPSFTMKLVAPYFIHRVPYSVRVPVLVALSSAGMFLIATTPPSSSIAAKMAGTVLASISSGIGELSFLGLTHFYGPMSLAAWGSGTGAAGLAGAGLYVVMTDWLRFTVRTSLLASAVLPIIMLLSFFLLLPHGPMQHSMGAAVPGKSKALGSEGEYAPVPGHDALDDELPTAAEEVVEEESARLAAVSPASMSASLLAPGSGVVTAYATEEDGLRGGHHHQRQQDSFASDFRRVRALFFPYMLPLLLVYVAEYTINQGVSPTLLFPLDESPFSEYRAFYPFYGFLYQLGVFVSRSSTPFYRIHHLYWPSLLQVVNLVILTFQSLYFDSFIPSVYLVFLIVFWEGLLGGAVYVNTFAEIMEKIPAADREFSLGATSVSDSGGICIAGLVGMAMEVSLCNFQVKHGRDWCRQIKASS